MLVLLYLLFLALSVGYWRDTEVPDPIVNVYSERVPTLRFVLYDYDTCASSRYTMGTIRSDAVPIDMSVYGSVSGYGSVCGTVCAYTTVRHDIVCCTACESMSDIGRVRSDSITPCVALLNAVQHM